MSALSSIAMLIPVLVVYGALRRPWRGGPAPLSRAAAASIAPSLGLGLASCLHFFLLIAELRRPAILRADVGLWSVALLVLGADAWHRRRRSAPVDEPNPAQAKGDRIVLIASAAGTAVLLALAARAFWVHRSLHPHGEWDAWAIWNLRARAMLRGAPDWTSVFSSSIAWSNVDYPLLLPLTVARLWAFEGAETTLIPAVVAFVFFASTAATVIVLVGQTRGWVSGLLSGALLVAPHTYVFQSSCQCADVPIAQFILVALAYGAMARQASQSGTMIGAAGAAAGLAAWTKNEGQVFLLLMLVSITTWPRRDRFRAWRWFGTGAAVPLAALLWFKLQLAPPNYLFTPTAMAGVLERLRDVERWALIRAQLTGMVPEWGEVPGGALVILAAVVALTAGVDRRALQRCTFGLSLIGLMLIGYILVYAVTPLPLLWQILTSFPRLMTQVWPALVWTLFQISGTAIEDQHPVIAT